MLDNISLLLLWFLFEDVHKVSKLLWNKNDNGVVVVVPVGAYNYLGNIFLVL